MDTNFPLNTTFLPPPCPPKGDIALISHSGAVCAISVDWSRGQDFGFSRLLSLGNQADVTETDMLEPVAADKHTRVLALYLEGVSSGDKFIEEARKASRQKPVLALKAGRTSSGKKAAASHTGALAGTDVAYEAAFRRAGIQRAQKVEEMFNWARALAWCPLPRGNRIAILTNAGGPGVMAADEIETSGLILANLEENTKSSLCELLVPAASVENPVDMLATASPKQFAESLRILLADAHVDGVLLIIPPPPMFTDIGIAEAVIPVIQTADKPVVVTLMGHDQIIEGKAAFREARIPIYSFPEPTVSAMAALVERARILEQEEETIIPTGIDDKKARELLAAAGSGWLPPQIIDDLLHYYGIPTPLMAIAHTAAEAVKLAAEIGFPVALKIISPGIIHKSEAGGIVLNLTDAELVAGTFADMTARAREIYPDEEIEGIMVQKMVRGGQEVISGVSRDPQFGPLVMFGSGGVEVEGLQDVAFELAPLTHLAAQRLLQETWAGKKLAGFRHIPAVDKTAVLDILIRLGQMTADHPQIVEIEINPLLVMAKGATAVDVRVRLV